jgi:hypothetical protein
VQWRATTALDVLGVQNRKRLLNTETTAQTLRQPFEAFELAALIFREKIV